LGLASRLDRKARERASERLRGVMRVDETVLDYDTASSDESPSDRVDLVATERALYLFFARTSDIARIPYEEILSIFWGGTSVGWGGRFFVTTKSNQYLMTMKRGYRSVGDIVERAVSERVLIERHIERPSGGGATFVYRPFKEGGDPWWSVKPDDGSSFEDQTFSAWVKTTTESLNAEVKVNRPPIRSDLPFAKHLPNLATFYLDKRQGAAHKWSWVMEPGVDGNTLQVQMECEQAMTRVEEELSLPLTWPRLASKQGRLDFVEGSMSTPAPISPVTSAPTLSPAKWAADPTGRHQLRYWNGETWTEHVGDSGVKGKDPL
jgi:hypothetical protein